MDPIQELETKAAKLSRLQNERKKLSNTNESDLALMRTTKKDEVIKEEDEYLDFILGCPGGFQKKKSILKDTT